MSNALNGVIAGSARRRILDDWSIMQRWTNGTAPNTLTQIADNTTAGWIMCGSCEIPGTDLVAIQFTPTSGGTTWKGGVFNRTTNIITVSTNSLSVASGSTEGSAIYCGVNKVFIFTGIGTASTGYYNYTTNTVSAGPSGANKGNFAWSNCTLGPNNKIYLVPRYVNNIGIIDHSLNTYIDGPAHGQPDNAYGSATVTPFGKIIFVPEKATRIGIYDIATNTFSDSSDTTDIRDQFWGSALAPNGKVIFAPCGVNTNNRIGIYDPINDTFAYGATTPATRWFYQAITTPSGKIVFIPGKPYHNASTGANFTNFGIYDPFSDTYTQGTTNPYASAGGPQLHGSLLSDGKIIVLGRYASGSTYPKINYLEGGNDVIAEHEKIIISPYMTR